MRKRPLLLLLPLVTTIGLITTGCEQTPQQKGAAELKQEWKRLGMLNNQETGQRGPIRIVTFYHVHVMLLRDLLDKTSPAVVEAEFQRICRTQVPDFAYDDDAKFEKNYDNLLLNAFLMQIVERKDAKRLDELLGQQCPQYFMYCPLEFYLANGWPGSMEHLFKCYGSTESQAVRKNVVSCLGRAFPALRIRFPADDEFVKQAQDWYTANHSRLQVNHDYQYVPEQPPSDGDTTNLFVLAP